MEVNGQPVMQSKEPNGLSVAQEIQASPAQGLSLANRVQTRLTRYGILWGINILTMGAIIVAFALSCAFPEPVEALKGFDFICMFKRLTHLPCPSCGFTRGFLMMSRGDWLAATQYNVLTVPLYLGCWSFFIISLLKPTTAVALLKRLISPKILLVALGLMMLAWVVKLSGDPTFW